jgi:Big-like domain-containing protein
MTFCQPVERRRSVRLWLGHAAALLALAVCTACADSPTSSTSTTGTPHEVTIVVSLIGSGDPPTASVVATVRDENGLPLSGLTVTFTTTSGFITTGTTTGADGVAVAVLTGSAGASPTVTASATANDQTASASTVVHF